MKRRLLAFFMAFAMMLSLVPPAAFAADAGGDPHFTKIVTGSGEALTASYVKTVNGEAAWGEKIDTPYYHVTVPEGTGEVQVTYPKDTAFVSDGSDESNALFFYMNTYPGQSEINYGGVLPVSVNEDGSKTVTIPVENFLVDSEGAGTAVGMAYQVDAESKSVLDFIDFAYAEPAPVTHAVTLTAGEGYTLAGEAAVEDGADYTFTLSVAEGYEKTDAFAVKANGEVLTAGGDGSYTVEAASADLTITVEGVAKKQTEPEQPFTSILTKDDQEVTVEYMATVPFTLNGVTYADAPYYHVTVPAKTRSVYVTYPADVEFDADGVAFTYALTIPDYTAKVGLVGLSVNTNSDGSKLICIDVEDFLLNDKGAGKAISLKYSGSQDPVNFFSFSYDPQTAVTHSVKLTTGEGYTLKGETTVEDGDDYTFTIAIADGYEKTDSFAVKVNGNTVQPNANGNCTVKSVSADLTVTVEGVAKKQEASTKRFTAIVTDDGKEVSAEFKGMIPVETYQTFNDGPYYHVTVPAGTKSVQVTYPASVNIAGGSAAYFYTLSVPDYTVGFGEGTLDVTTNSDGSKTMTIPVAPYLLDASGKGTAASAEYSVSFDPITFFSFAYEGGAAVSHNVTLTAGEGYTLTGEATVEEGSDYSFTIAIADDYEKTDAFAVKANEEALTANSDGSYTVKSVSADLTVTVEGVAKKQTVPFSGIVTDSGKEVTVEYQGMVPAKNDYSTYDDTPYYHVTVPAGTTSVQVTYPASVDMMGTNTAYGYTLTIPDHVLYWTSSGFDFTTNDDGSKTVTIPIADYLLDASGKGTAVSVEYNNYNPISFFTFAYEPAVTHKVDLSSGSGYTLTGADTVEDGADYTFHLEIADGYGKGDSFEVTANGKILTANEDGSYTVKNVTSDLRISVRGVYGAYTVYLPESRDGYTLTDYVTGEELPSSIKLAMTKKYEIKVTLKDGYAVRGNDYGVDFTVGMVVRTDTYDGYAVITIQTVTGDGRIAINGVKQLVKITLPEGEGYKVTPTKDNSNPILKGDFYYFSVTIAEGYEKTDAFAVKANGETLTANDSGSYTAQNFDADLTITVEGVAKKQSAVEAPFSAIVTDTGKEVTTEYKGMLSAKSDYASYNDSPYFHVTVPTGTKEVLVTYPASVDVFGTTGAYAYTMTIPGHVLGWTSGGFAMTANSDGSKTVTIPIANYLLDADGKGTAVSLEYNDGNYNPIGFLSFGYVAHTVTLTAGEGYTLTGAATAEDGKDYTFTLTIAEGYHKGGAFAVKADGKALKANEDGTYTVSNVTADVEITVEGVAKQPENGLSELSFAESSKSSAERFRMTPAFDPAVKEYTVLVPDSVANFNVWATRGDDLSTKGVIKAQWTNQMSSTGAVKTLTIGSGSASGQSMSGAATAGDKGNTITLTVRDGDYSDTYTVTIVRTDPTLQKLGLGTVKLDKSFTSAKKEYTASTADESVTVVAEPRGSSYTVTVNGKDDKTVPLEMGENVITVEVQNTRGDKNTYTVTVTRVAAVMVTLDVTPANAKLTLTDSKGTLMTPDGTGTYRLMAGSTYYYTATAGGYKRTTGSFTVTESGPVSIALEKDTSKPVTVYFSFSHDEKFEFCEESGTTMALKKVTVPYFDLANYGMEGFYFHSEDYGAVDPDNPGQGSALEPGTAEYAYGKITMLHLFIYATEVYRCGIDPADAGQGYLLDSDLLGTDLFSYSGSTGSIFLNTIWNYDLNLNYYLNHEYPLASEGWGSTCDQILLHDDDVVTLGHFTDWSFFNDSTSVFNHFEADNDSPNQGDKITLSVIRDGADMYGTYNTAHTPVTYSPDIYYAPADEIYDGDVTTWIPLGTADEEGHLTVDTSALAPGEYIFAMAGQYGAEYPDAICSTPGGMRITVRERDAQRKGDINGDGVMDVVDVTALFNAISGEETLDTFVADVNRDGVVDMFDVIALYDSIRSE